MKKMNFLIAIFAFLLGFAVYYFYDNFLKEDLTFVNYQEAQGPPLSKTSQLNPGDAEIMTRLYRKHSPVIRLKDASKKQIIGWEVEDTLINYIRANNNVNGLKIFLARQWKTNDDGSKDTTHASYYTVIVEPATRNIKTNRLDSIVTKGINSLGIQATGAVAFDWHTPIPK
ncbi:hypothetical protein [Ferruginibacter albus]|uniref:hypothetical protein n=1 Tax=Ferruginibacter albus TaxID=2875540 RepID=UPI001CC55339|nr:hypothetical protein [Ferruginibacter albus]UAY52636.1 hypothetical protein K9M53_02835 [Ferruginibacter albus]